jgi:hypothetical protein
MSNPSNAAIELDDSVLESISMDGKSVRLLFEPAYRRRRAARPGVDAGLGFVQNSILEVENGRVEGEVGSLPTEIFDGSLQLPSDISENVLILPPDPSGPIEVILQLAPDNRRICITGSLLKVQATSEAFT